MMTRIRRLAEYAVAVVSGLLGVGALSLLGLFLWTGAFGIIEMKLEQRWVLSWDAGLCLLFFLQHSGMVRRSFRTRLSGIVPVYLQGIVYTIASGITLLSLVVCWQPSPVNVYVLKGAEQYLI